MKLEWKYVKPLKKADSLQMFCRKQKIILPDKLMGFLESNNGGRPSKPVFNTDKGVGYVFNSLYSYNEGDANSIFDKYASAFVAPELFPLGLEASGNPICIDLKTGLLVLVNREAGDVETIDYRSNPELFNGFIS